MLFPYISKGPHLQRDMLTSALFGGILLSMLLLVSLLVLGPMLTQHNIYVSYILAQKIDIGRFFQRIEALMAIAWLISTYFKSMLHIFAFIVGTAQLFKMQNYKPLILPSMLLFFAMGVLIAPNIIFYTLTIMPAWFELDITVSTVIPLFLLLIHRFRKRFLANHRALKEAMTDKYHLRLLEHLERCACQKGRFYGMIRNHDLWIHLRYVTTAPLPPRAPLRYAL